METPEIEKRFGQAMKRARKQAGLTQAELGERADLNRTYISDVERGERNLSLVCIARIVDAFGVSLGTFFASLDVAANGVALSAQSYSMTEWSESDDSKIIA